MDALIGTLAAASAVVRTALLGVALLVGAVALGDWAVRTRRLNPFGPVARFFRQRVDPLLAPVERRVVNMGGRPSSAPLWALAAVVIGGLLLLALLDFLGLQLWRTSVALQSGVVGVLLLVVIWTFGLLRLALIVRVLTSWFPISPFSPWVRWTYTLTEWMLRPLRQVIPRLGPVDITPIAAYFGLLLLEFVLLAPLR